MFLNKATKSVFFAPGMMTVPSGSRVSGLILMADIVWLLVSRYNKYPWGDNTNTDAYPQSVRTLSKPYSSLRRNFHNDEDYTVFKQYINTLNVKQSSDDDK